MGCWGQQWLWQHLRSGSCSQTRVHRVSSLLEDDLVEDRKEQAKNG